MNTTKYPEEYLILEEQNREAVFHAEKISVKGEAYHKSILHETRDNRWFLWTSERYLASDTPKIRFGAVTAEKAWRLLSRSGYNLQRTVCVQTRYGERGDNDYLCYENRALGKKWQIPISMRGSQVEFAVSKDGCLVSLCNRYKNETSLTLYNEDGEEVWDWSPPLHIPLSHDCGAERLIVDLEKAADGTLSNNKYWKPCGTVLLKVGGERFNFSCEGGRVYFSWLDCRRIPFEEVRLEGTETVLAKCSTESRRIALRSLFSIFRC